MPKVKIPRKSTNIDMTAMCDVAFLLLTFFMLTTKFKSDDPVVVMLPSSISEVKIPESNLVTVTVDKDGKVFFGMEGKFNREALLKRIAEDKKLSFTDEQVHTFSLLGSIGVPLSELPKFLDLNGNDRTKPEYNPGIPVDSTNNELKDWLKFAKIVVYESSRELYTTQVFAIKGDGGAAYPRVKKVIDIFQDKQLQINKFRLITSLEAAPPARK